MLKVRRRENVTGQFANMRGLPVGYETSRCHVCGLRCRVICGKRGGGMLHVSQR